MLYPPPPWLLNQGSSEAASPDVLLTSCSLYGPIIIEEVGGGLP